MVEKRSWREFQEIGLLWWMNRILHTFGWVIVFDPSTNTAYPSKTEWRGFDEKTELKGFEKINSNFIKIEE